MPAGVVLLNFGEPERPTREAVVDYLERIFLANADIDGDVDREDAEDRAAKLARRRAPGLIEEYEKIDGSPLCPQSIRQADLLQTELGERGYDARTYLGMQHTEPFIPEAVDRARSDGIDHLVGVPMYPLCGPSTNVESLEKLGDAVSAANWDVEVDELVGWHRHPGYTRLRTRNIQEFLTTRGLSIDDDTQLVFSAHGTPIYYLDEGSRYETYVEEYCETVAASLGVDSYNLGYQNHENRDVEWTKPDVETVIENLDAERVVVEPVSFMHEQSETLSELDVELRAEAVEAGIDFYRVPIPFDDNRFIEAIADLVEPFLAGFDPDYYQLRRCNCRDAPRAFCLNAPR